jgi:hypothetical protein
MDRRSRLVLLPGGRPPGAPARRRLSRSNVRVLDGGVPPDVERAIAAAVAAAKEIRRERERRIARALDIPDDQGV